MFHNNPSGVLSWPPQKVHSTEKCNEQLHALLGIFRTSVSASTYPPLFSSRHHRIHCNGALSADTVENGEDSLPTCSCDYPMPHAKPRRAKGKYQFPSKPSGVGQSFAPGQRAKLGLEGVIRLNFIGNMNSRVYDESPRPDQESYTVGFCPGT